MSEREARTQDTINPLFVDLTDEEVNEWHELAIVIAKFGHIPTTNAMVVAVAIEEYVKKTIDRKLNEVLTSLRSGTGEQDDTG